MKSEGTILVRNDISELTRLTAFVEQFCAANQLPPDLEWQLGLALEEVFTNVVRHGLGGQGDHEIRIEMARDASEVTLLVEDAGVLFDPLSAPPPDIESPLAERPVGGLGIHLVRQVMDTLIYTRVNDHNRLLMKKHIEENT